MTFDFGFTPDAVKDIARSFARAAVAAAVVVLGAQTAIPNSVSGAKELAAAVLVAAGAAGLRAVENYLFADGTITTSTPDE